jgi:hypothetical protein
MSLHFNCFHSEVVSSASIMFLLSIALFVSATQATLVPGPPGPYQVSYGAHALTDESRWETFAPPGISHKRRIMVSTFLPVDPEHCSSELVPYMPPRTVVTYGEYANGYGLPVDLFEGYEFEFCSSSTTSVPDANTTHKYPLVIFSPGLTASRLLYGAQARALASYGYAVITVDHPYDATVVEFPDGTIVNATLPRVMNDTMAEIAVEVCVHQTTCTL